MFVLLQFKLKRKNMKKLKLNDFVYCQKRGSTPYEISEVVRLTAKLAILSNGTRLINEPRLDWGGKHCYRDYGNKYGSDYYILTNDILEENKRRKKISKVNIAIKNNELTDDIKLEIYNLISKTN